MQILLSRCHPSSNISNSAILSWASRKHFCHFLEFTSIKQLGYRATDLKRGSNGILAGAYDLELSGAPELGSIQSNRWNIAYNVQIW